MGAAWVNEGGVICVKGIFTGMERMCGSDGFRCSGTPKLLAYRRSMRSPK